jgi:hypothetical protein
VGRADPAAEREQRRAAGAVRTGSQPDACAAVRDLAIGAFRRAGYVNIAHARRYYGRDDQRALGLCGYSWEFLLAGGRHR